MKNFLRVVLLINIFYISIVHAASVEESMSFKTISTKELKHMLSDSNVELIDVRSTEEFLAKHLNEARNIPLPILDQSQLCNQDNKIVLQCASGARSTLAARKLKASNPDLDIYILNDGIDNCKKFGHNIVKNPSGEKLPIMRQVQIIAGSIIVLGITLTIFVSKSFIIVPLFIGCGLVFAGITGWCGMAKLLALMPWN